MPQIPCFVSIGLYKKYELPKKYRIAISIFRKTTKSRSSLFLDFKSKESFLDTWEKSFVRLIKSGKHFLLPFGWDSNKRLLTLNNNHGKKAVALRLLLIWFWMDIFYMSSVSKSVTLKKFSETEFVNFYVHFISRTVAGIIILILLRDLKGFVAFNNVLLVMRRKFLVRWTSKLGKHVFIKIKNTEMLLTFSVTFTVWFAHIQPFMPLIMHLQNRHSLRYWPSKYMNHELYDSLPVTVIYGLNDLLFSYFALFGALYVIVSTISYLSLASIWITILSQSIDNGMFFHLAIRIYKEQLILNRIANSFLSHHHSPTFLLGGSFCLVQCIVAIIKSENSKQSAAVLANFVIVTFLIAWGFQLFIDISGRLWTNSKRIKNELFRRGCRRKRSLEARKVRGCPELRFYVRDDFYFKPSTYLSFMKHIMDYSVTVLLATQK